MKSFKILSVFLTCMLMQLRGMPPEDTASANACPPGENYMLNEKIVLETDREFYLSGEDINVSCIIHEPLLQIRLDISKIVYIELYTQSNQILDQIKIAIEKGSGNGSLRIPRRLSSGTCFIRAYTNYLKNFGCEAFSYSSVTVMNPFEDFTGNDKVKSPEAFLQKCTIHPEGGHIINGHSNTIVCEFSDNMGYPVICTARVMDHNSREVTSFSTNEYGLGSFQLTPVPGAGYRIEATNGTVLIEERLDIQENSVTLARINQDPENIQFKLLQFGFEDYPVYLDIYSDHTCRRLLTLAPADSVVTFPLKGLPSGIIQFRLLNSRKEILSFRNIFNPPDHNKLLKIHTNGKEFANREVVELTLQNESPDQAREALSVSVFMMDRELQQEYIKGAGQQAIMSALFSFLGGSPYPAQEAMKNETFLEQVLIARGQFNMGTERIHDPGYDKLAYFPEIMQDLVTGMVVDDRNIPVSSFPVIQTWIDTVSFMQTLSTNKEGRFVFETDKTGENRMILTFKKSQQAKVILQDEFFPEFLSLAQDESFINPLNIKGLKQMMLNLQINDSFYERKDNAGIKQRLPFYRLSDQIFRISDYIQLPTLEEFLFEVVPGILPYHSGNKTIIRISFPQTDVSFGNDPLFLVDGVPIFDSDLIAKLRCSDLVSVGIVYEKYFYQNESFDGILDIHTHKGDASILSIPETINLVYFTGVQPALSTDRFNPDPDFREPFFRTQLYWNPDVTQDQNGIAILTFTTPDNAGDYLIRCGLIYADGSVRYSFTSFSVR